MFLTIGAPHSAPPNRVPQSGGSAGTPWYADGTRDSRMAGSGGRAPGGIA